MKLTVDIVRRNLAYYMSKHTPLTKDEVEQQFNEWLLDLTEQIIEVRENQIIKLLEQLDPLGQIDTAFVPELIELIKVETKVSDPLEQGYKHLAGDHEFTRPNRGKHHCGFDFKPNRPTATCNCGAIATNPLWTVEGQKKNQELLANPWYPSPYFTVIDEFDSDVFKVTATEWEKLNAELDKD